MKAERAYIYAKAAGIISRSFVESRIKPLAAVTNIETLYEMVFSKTDTSENADLIEKRLKERETEAVHRIISSFSKPEPLLFLLADIENNDNKKDESLSIAEIAERNSVYYTKLWEALVKIPPRERLNLTHIITEEIRLKNAVWALRMRSYYLMHPDRIKKLLVRIKPEKNARSFSYEAEKTFDWDIEEEAEWRKWRFSKFLNQSGGMQYWKADPRYFQTQAALYLYKLSRRYFRRRPFSLDAAACFIKLKQFETEVLTAVAEAARLGMTGAEALQVLGLTDGN